MPFFCWLYRLIERWGPKSEVLRPNCSAWGRVSAISFSQGSTIVWLSLLSGDRRRCVITPCAHVSLHQRARQLWTGQRVIVKGQELLVDGEPEIHSVTAIVLVDRRPR